MNLKPVAIFLLSVLLLSPVRAADPGFEMRLIVPPDSTKVPEGAVKKTLKDYHGGADRELLCEKEVLLDSKALKSAHAYEDPIKGWIIVVEFTDEGGKEFAKITTANTRRQLGILSNGQLISAPQLNEPILGGRAEITGRFNEKEARDLAKVFKNGTGAAAGDPDPGAK